MTDKEEYYGTHQECLLAVLRDIVGELAKDDPRWTQIKPKVMSMTKDHLKTIEIERFNLFHAKQD